MNSTTQKITLELESTNNVCKIGEVIGQRNINEGRTPVLSCEGACIRGEIARLAANLVAKQKGVARACHGELLTVPNSAIAEWVKSAESTIMIDGCGLRCHGRILEQLLGDDRVFQFNAVSVYKKYSDIFDADDVSPEERQAAAQQVAEAVISAVSLSANN